MEKFKKFLNLIFKLIIIVSFVISSIWAYGLYKSYTDFPQPATYDESTPSPNIFEQSATRIAEAGNPIPTQEYVYLRLGDIPGLQAYLNSQAQNWLNMSLNIHSLDIFGVASSSERVEGTPCGWGNSAGDLLCRYAIIEYTAVYKGVMTGGTQAEFILHPVVTMGEDWTEVNSVIEGNKTTISYQATATITFSGEMCITSVEENTPSSVLDGEVPPTDKSYTIKTLDERRLWPDLGPWIFPTDINEDYLRLDAYKKAKDIALWPQNVNYLYDLIEADMKPSGAFYEKVKSFYTPELAQMYHVKGFLIVMNPTRGDPLVRCDGSYVNK
ncbi:MAG: hypothetical protein UW16_C0031G0005 [Microgenomates group bacterium GW2011_GWC1_44_10]|nr:MAG: hypothetical protein UW16_C0031G0005 [Microgenomates group bacterium GW2011_GWC1_44_10]